jgi:hypothetical protein
MPCPRPQWPPFPTALLLALAAVLIPVAAAGEQESDSPLRSGAWALEFAVDPGLAYGGSATLAAKRHVSTGRAVRFGANIGFSEDKREGIREEATYDPPYDPAPVSSVGSVDQHSESHNYVVFAHVVSERSVRDHVALFGEFGPSFRYTESHYQSESLFGFPSPFRSTSDDHALERAVGVDFNFGFEWFFSKRLSLGARYGGFAAYGWGATNSRGEFVYLDGSGYRYVEERLDTKGVDVGTSRATITFAAYL